MKCRNPKCTKGAKCKDLISQLHWKHMPQTPADVETFLCETCVKKKRTDAKDASISKATQALQCALCKEEKTKAEFPQQQWIHRNDAGCVLRCYDCWHPQCTEPSCRTCKKCRNPKCTKGEKCKDPILQLNSKHIPNKFADVESFLCEKCQKLQCSLCEEWKSKGAFSADQLKNSTQPGRRLRCIDCSHPPCMAPNCKTCAICRSTGCKKRKGCKDPIVPLNLKQMPKSPSAVNSFMCENCRYVTCATKGADDRICGKVAKKGHAELRAKKESYKCGDCLTAEKSSNSLAAASVRK